ncbi:hypothetical protein KKF84_07645 [Myxococcota bacterium]|nr:hypothetical protein [Myxococcota bacterium]
MTRIFVILFLVLSFSTGCDRGKTSSAPGLKRLRADMHTMVGLLERGDSDSVKEFLVNFVDLSRMSRRDSEFNLDSYVERFLKESRERYLKTLKQVLNQEPVSRVGKEVYSFRIQVDPIPKALKRLVNKSASPLKRKIIRGQRFRFQWDNKRGKYRISPR